MIDEKKLANWKGVLNCSEAMPVEFDLEEVIDSLEALWKVTRAAMEVDKRWRDPYTTQVRTTAALLAMGKALAALKEKA